jgi:hypothetical protein
LLPFHSLDDLALILGLSLGLGIPVTATIISGLIYYFKVFKPKQKVIPSNDTTAGIFDIPLVPTNTANANNTDSTVIV